MTAPVRIFSETVIGASGAGVFTPGLNTIQNGDILVLWICTAPDPGNPCVITFPSSLIFGQNPIQLDDQLFAMGFYYRKQTAAIAGPTIAFTYTGADPVIIFEVIRNSEGGIRVVAGLADVFPPQPIINEPIAQTGALSAPFTNYKYSLIESVLGRQAAVGTLVTSPSGYSVYETANGAAARMVAMSRSPVNLSVIHSVYLGPSTWSVPSSYKVAITVVFPIAEIPPEPVVVGCSPDSV